MNKMIDDTECISEWRKLLSVFHMIIQNNPTSEQAKEPLEKLRDATKASANLTPHQVSAIMARCDNYLNREYGNTKKPEHYSQEHNHSLKK